jgi:hypothetical protein
MLAVAGRPAAAVARWRRAAADTSTGPAGRVLDLPGAGHQSPEWDKAGRSGPILSRCGFLPSIPPLRTRPHKSLALPPVFRPLFCHALLARLRRRTTAPSAASNRPRRPSLSLHVAGLRRCSHTATCTGRAGGRSRADDSLHWRPDRDGVVWLVAGLPE